MTDQRYPLHWPEGWQRTPRGSRKSSPYKVSEQQARNDLLHSLKLLGARNVILSTNIELRLDGLPYVNRRIPDDTGVAVYWTRRGKQEVIACDTYGTIGANYRALGLTVEALRAIERAGASQLLERAFTGFAALPAASAQPDWRAVLGLTKLNMGHPDRAMIEAAFRFKLKTEHPDQGGTDERLRALVQAKEAAFREVPR